MLLISLHFAELEQYNCVPGKAFTTVKMLPINPCYVAENCRIAPKRV